MTKHLSNTFIFELEGFLYIVTWSGSWVLDNAYGADLDGNRTQPTYIQESLDWKVLDDLYQEVHDTRVELEAERRLDKVLDYLEFNDV